MNFLNSVNRNPSSLNRTPDLQTRSILIETAPKIQEMVEKQDGSSAPVDSFSPGSVRAQNPLKPQPNAQFFQIQQQVAAEQEKAKQREINEKVSRLLTSESPNAAKPESGPKVFSGGVKAALNGLLGGR